VDLVLSASVAVEMCASLFIFDFSEAVSVVHLISFKLHLEAVLICVNEFFLSSLNHDSGPGNLLLSLLDLSLQLPDFI
jgi:hypothetical protein